MPKKQEIEEEPGDFNSFFVMSDSKKSLKREDNRNNDLTK